MLANVAEQRAPYALKFADRLEALHVDKLPANLSTTTVSNVTLYRLAATAGMGSALILLVNAAKRGSLIPASDLTQLLAPFAEVLALGFVIGLFMAFGRRAGLFGLVAFAMNFIALASLEGVEVVINLIFAKLPLETIVELRAGPLGLMLTVASILFLVGSLAFVASMFAGKGVPRIPLILYAVGVVPIAFRAFVPELALDLGLVSLAVAIGWLAVFMWISAHTIGHAVTDSTSGARA
ncbi:hypothetical protein [Mesorhizobium sp. YR577]|uniref:hypothetical protein n=1 Tax=Mesorhizobium sp. YR577 TaxID=1884373 RepID=UPI0008E2731F|nr:hypothetical protein [Mesorhizobium sp. YR577]SFU23403.1 hypothetical protein SAMN05518861_1615 [Mesorhizobium sp. YR577]